MTNLTTLSVASSADQAAKALRSPEALHRGLAHWNHDRLSPTLPSTGWRDDLRDEHEMRLLEGAWVEHFRAEIGERAATAPREADGFIAWFEQLQHDGPGQGDPLFPWLAESASRDEMRWFLEQEAAGEAGFDDLVALTQVKVEPARAKLELAANYWDEMGRGNEGGMHGPMLQRTTEGLDLHPAIDTTCWESLALANTMVAFATTRRYAYQSIGALGAVELTAPGRTAMVAAGLKRLGAEPKHRKYFDLHAILDVKHSEDWNREVMHPIVAAQPEAALAIAEGALMRLACGARCFEAYRGHLWREQRAAAV